MSGTSLDGIDVAVIDIQRNRFETVAHRTSSYPSKIRERLLGVSNADTHTREISRLNFELPELYARAVRQCGVDLASIELVGCHGQTIYHERQSTLQIGDGSVLAERLGIPVVSDFRTRDMAAGGRGAPLVPFVDYWLFRGKRRSRVALNIGGIANISAIPAGASADQVIAFDTGPGNMILDSLVKIHTKGRQKFDRGGRIAAQGRVDRKLLDRLLTQPYYRQVLQAGAAEDRWPRTIWRRVDR
jgi:anhydro-N-acetylmuramic acid kinase